VQLLNESNDQAAVKRWNPNAKNTVENDEMKIYFKSLIQEA
jgi:hypothetical protein